MNSTSYSFAQICPKWHFCLLIHRFDETGNISGSRPFCLLQFDLEFVDILLGMFAHGGEQANLRMAISFPSKTLH